MTPGPNHLIEGLKDYQPTGRYGIHTPSTSSTGINLWPWNNNLSMPHRYTPAAPQLGRAPWSRLAHVLEERTGSLSPPPVELSVYHPLQTTTSDTDTLVHSDIPKAIRIQPVPNVPRDIDPDEDQHTPRELLRLEHRGEEDPFNVDGPDFEWPKLAPIDREIMGAARATAREFRRHDIEDHATVPLGPQRTMDLYLALNRGEPLNDPGALPLNEQILANQERRVWDPAVGSWVRDLQPRTADEQSALEHALSCVVWQEGPWCSHAAL